MKRHIVVNKNMLVERNKEEMSSAVSGIDVWAQLVDGLAG